MCACECTCRCLGGAHQLSPFVLSLIQNEPSLVTKAVNIIYLEFELRELRKLKVGDDALNAIRIFEKSLEETVGEAVETMKRYVGRD